MKVNQDQIRRTTDIRNTNHEINPEVFSLKDSTKDKTEMIRRELGIIEKKATVWNQMMQAIDQIHLESNSQF